MTTLFDATLALAKILGNVRSSITTAAGSATTIVDSTRTEPADFWNDGTLWITSGTHASKSRKITDWALVGTTFTIPTTTTAAGSGVTYSVINGIWPQDKLIEFINAALRVIGDVPKTDDTLTTVANQEEYTLPTGVYNVLWVCQALYTAAPYTWVPQYNTHEREGKLVFDPLMQPDQTGYAIRLIYASPHAVMDDDADVISNYVHLERLIWNAAVMAWRWRMQMSKTDEPMYSSFYTEATAKAVLMDAKYPILMPDKQPRFAAWP